MLASESRSASALVSRSVVEAGGAVLAHTSSTGVKLVLASHASEVGRAGAVEAGAKVLALAAVHAGVANATLGSRLAMLAVRSRWAPKQN